MNNHTHDVNLSQASNPIDPNTEITNLRQEISQLNRALRVKDQFLADMSHELRTPLNSILGLSEVLHEGIFGEINNMQQECVQTIEESGKHLLTLINDILDLSKTEAGKMELHIDSVDIPSTCKSSFNLVKELAHNKQIDLGIDIDPSLTSFLADGRRLKQMLVNLLSNALKFTNKKGRVQLVVKGDIETGTIRFSVIDNGIGIAQNQLDSLFKPFTQLRSTFSKESIGSGLGLSLVLRFAELHGGHVHVESKVDQGSNFTVVLPWKTETISENNDAPITPQYKNALIIEDWPAAAHQLAYELAKLGCESTIHHWGSDALERTLAVKPDVIFLDIHLPDMFGWEVLAQLKSEARTNHIPVFIVSVDDDHERGLALGAEGCLLKPISAKRLEHVLYEETLTTPSTTADERAFALKQQPLILIAEDNEPNLKMLLDYLQISNYRVCIARDGLETLAMARSRKPDLILLDVKMPKMSGLDVLEQLNEDSNIANIPTIALTALAMSGDRERILAAGADEYLTKPINLKVLLTEIESQLTAYATHRV